MKITGDGVAYMILDRKTIEKYGLNSSANVRRLKDALEKKEIVVFDGDDVPRIIDPLFKYWIKKYYFAIQ